MFASAVLHASLRSARRVSLAMVVLAGSCGQAEQGPTRSLEAEVYQDKLLGSWQAIMVANESGLDLQGIWLDQPGPDGAATLLFPGEWSTDDDTHVEWLDLQILETYGIEPSYQEITNEWIDHLNNDIWVATRTARDLMDEGVLPPLTGSPELNPDGVWSMDAQLETELFGMLAPGLAQTARRQARFFAAITNSGLAVDVSAFYAHLYSEAFFESDIDWLIDRALAAEPTGSEIPSIVENVRAWHQDHPQDWRTTRNLIRDAYDTDPAWWASRVNFAATIMALLYGEGDLLATVDIAALAGWDADNNMTTSAGLLGIVLGADGLPPEISNSTDRYFNQDLTGDLPKFDSVRNIAERTYRLGEVSIFRAGGTYIEANYLIPIES